MRKNRSRAHVLSIALANIRRAYASNPWLLALGTTMWTVFLSLGLAGMFSMTFGFDYYWLFFGSLPFMIPFALLIAQDTFSEGVRAEREAKSAEDRRVVLKAKIRPIVSQFGNGVSGPVLSRAEIDRLTDALVVRLTQ
ncbi:MAG: hypothetical protein EOP83_01640 [Verrucomicrobiaceae bacterium]|nr:MAG: hypothetical protein EOP83_01640 [Verrucomicrobiaceae bacterium]